MVLRIEIREGALVALMDRMVLEVEEEEASEVDSKMVALAAEMELEEEEVMLPLLLRTRRPRILLQLLEAMNNS